MVSDEEFEKIMNIKERFGVGSNDSLNLNHRKTLNSILRTKSQQKNKSIEAIPQKLEDDSVNLNGRKKSKKRVSFANSLLSKTQSNDQDFTKNFSKKGSILKKTG